MSFHDPVTRIFVGASVECYFHLFSTSENFSSDILIQPVASPSASGPSLNFVLENATDNVLTEIKVTQLRQFIIDARRSIISSSAGVITLKLNRSHDGSFRSSVALGGMSTYLGSVDFIDKPIELTHALSKILYIWRESRPLTAIFTNRTCFTTSSSFNMLAPILMTHIVCCTTFILPFRG